MGKGKNKTAVGKNPAAVNNQKVVDATVVTPTAEELAKVEAEKLAAAEKAKVDEVVTPTAEELAKVEAEKLAAAEKAKADEVVTPTAEELAKVEAEKLAVAEKANTKKGKTTSKKTEEVEDTSDRQFELDGEKYEILFKEFFYKGKKHQYTDVLGNTEVLATLVENNSFVIKKL